MNPDHQSCDKGLRSSAMGAGAGSKRWTCLSDVWRELNAGTTRVVDNFFSDEREYLILSPRCAPDLGPWHERLAILEDVLCANAQKIVALEREMAPSTIASSAKASLLFLGLTCNPSRVPPLLQQAARASRQPALDQHVEFNVWCEQDISYAAVSAVRTEGPLRKVLSEAEFKVVRALVEGCSHVEIARERGTSRRTIANQLATAFRRIGVSSRGELLHRLSDASVGAALRQNTSAA